MRKNNNSFSDIFVKKMQTKKWKIFTREDLLGFWVSCGGAPSRLSFGIKILEEAHCLFRVAKSVYFVGNESDAEENYWEIISFLVKKFCFDGAILAGEKALEWQMMNQSPPEILLLYTRDFSARMRIFGGREVHFRTVMSGKKSHGKNFFPLMKKISESSGVRGIFCPFQEIALLEALSLKNHHLGVNEAMIFAFLRRHHRRLRMGVLAEVIPFRYIRPLNRLRAIARAGGYDNLHAQILWLISSHGGGIILSL